MMVKIGKVGVGTMKTGTYVGRQNQASLVEKYRMIGESMAFLETMGCVSLAAKVNRPVLIIGERGTGKELVAARLHYLSPRWQQPRVAINCAAFSPELLESEVFGYEQGAFTGANRTKPGRFELANGGSLFLDELANSPMALQEKILRVIEYGEFERVGGTETIQVDVRLIAATNQDLPSLCRQGRFKEDLLDRLCFEVITLPPLRERREDIPHLIFQFALKMSRELNLSKPPRFERKALEQLLEYSWPGNIRELKNVVERAVYRAGGELVEEVVFDPFESPFRPAVSQLKGEKANGQEPKSEAVCRLEEADWEAFASPEERLQAEGAGMAKEKVQDYSAAVEAFERSLVKRALERQQYNQRKAAEELNLSYYQFRRVLKRLGI